jgi:hypothetical protein
MLERFVPYETFCSVYVACFFNNCFVLLFYGFESASFYKKSRVSKKFPPKHKQACLRNGVSLFSCVVLDKLSRKMLGAVVAISAQDYRLH